MAGATVVAAVIGAGSAYFSSVESAREKRRAAEKATRASEAARAEEKGARQPYRDAGVKALESLTALTAAGPGGPMYQWRRRQEEDAMESRLRASGTYKSGRMTQLMSGIGQRLTAEETDAYESRLMSIARMGQGGTGGGGVDTQGYYAEGAARAQPWQEVGQGISTVAGTWADAVEQRRQQREREERQRRADEEARRANQEARGGVLV